MKCPCEDCLIVPICKQKLWSQALDGCVKLRKYIRHKFNKDEVAPRSQTIKVPIINKNYVVSKFNKELMVANGRIPKDATQKIKRMRDEDAI